MLVVTRKQGESLVIDDNIEITVLEIQGGSVKIGIEAPKNISILRKELIVEIGRENIESTKNIEDIIKKIK
ncbi:carbon storage regulator CsrA [Fonticella tunisiensis]|uniref:Translational regulator CsrA n=1 Tax=Fonticella tunisiensis TaxID=1096341 RepID=A0A4R7KB08_9CLOT|nr:carbon storage regulator CsrA [Fonticella tunisiensis]TDT50620.1 carbon storage regulator CsrA [Fonticella tunisiensis]